MSLSVNFYKLLPHYIHILKTGSSHKIKKNKIENNNIENKKTGKLERKNAKTRTSERLWTCMTKSTGKLTLMFFSAIN